MIIVICTKFQNDLTIDKYIVGKQVLRYFFGRISYITIAPCHPSLSSGKVAYSALQKLSISDK